MTPDASEMYDPAEKRRVPVVGEGLALPCFARPRGAFEIRRGRARPARNVQQMHGWRLR